MTEINWANLVAQGRAYAVGIPWTEEQALARAAGVPAEFVREGVLSFEEYTKKRQAEDKAIESGEEKPLNRMNRNELIAKATELGIEFAPSVTVASLKEIITNKLNEEVSDEESEDDSESKENE